MSEFILICYVYCPINECLYHYILMVDPTLNIGNDFCVQSNGALRVLLWC